MTMIVWDGVNLLADRITTATSSDILDEQGQEKSYYFEGHDSKIILASDHNWDARVWGNTIKAFTMVGDTEYRQNWLHFLERGDDVSSLIETAISFPHVISDGATYLVVDEENTLHVFERDGNKINSNYFKDTLGKPAVFGCASSVENMNLAFSRKDNPFTAIELLVLGQATYPSLGRRFDHWNANSNVITRDNDLSDRERLSIVQKGSKRIVLTYKPHDIQVVNR